MVKTLEPRTEQPHHVVARCDHLGRSAPRLGDAPPVLGPRPPPPGPPPPPTPHHGNIGALPVENVTPPLPITDAKTPTPNHPTANGGKPLISHRESIEMYGHSTDVDKTLQEIAEDEALNAFEPTL